MAIVCKRCNVGFDAEHPAQTICRVCMTPRCPVCRVLTGHRGVYCSPTCRQRARAGSRYMILNRDDYTCRVCGATTTENDPLLLRFVSVVSWGAPPTAANTVTLCDSCSLPADPAMMRALADGVARRNKFFVIDPNEPLKSLSRGQKRRKARRRARP